MTSLLDEGKTVEVSTWTSAKPLTISHSLLLEKLGHSWLGWVEFSQGKKLAGWWAQGAMGNGVTPRWWSVTRVSPGPSAGASPVLYL